MDTYNRLLKEFRANFTGPVSDLIKYLVNNKIMTKTKIAKEMGISRQTLYTKYLKE